MNVRFRSFLISPTRITVHDATGYEDTGASAGATHTYEVCAENAAGLLSVRASAVVTMPMDTTPPEIAWIYAAAYDATRVLVRFSEPVETATAETAGNYAINGGIFVSAASLSAT